VVVVRRIRFVEASQEGGRAVMCLAAEIRQWVWLCVLRNVRAGDTRAGHGQLSQVERDVTGTRHEPRYVKRVPAMSCGSGRTYVRAGGLASERAGRRGETTKIAPTSAGTRRVIWCGARGWYRQVACMRRDLHSCVVALAGDDICLGVRGGAMQFTWTCVFLLIHLIVARLHVHCMSSGQCSCLSAWH
jgi:hypothetical protein